MMIDQGLRIMFKHPDRLTQVHQSKIHNGGHIEMGYKEHQAM